MTEAPSPGWGAARFRAARFRVARRVAVREALGCAVREALGCAVREALGCAVREALGCAVREALGCAVLLRRPPARWTFGLAVLAVLATGDGVRAQVTAPAPDGPRVVATVTQVAGQNAYLDAGSDAGLATGDTLVAFRGDERAGRLVVVGAAAGRAVVSFAGEAFPLTRGERLTLALPARAPTPVAERAPPPADSVATARPSLLDRPAEPRPSATRAAPAATRLTGRFQVGMDGLQSTTGGSPGAPAVARTFATPFAALRLAAEGLPGGLRVDVNARTSYRWADGATLERPSDLRLYTLSVERAGRVQLRAGRFTVEHDRFSGGWDGLMLHLGSRERGLGVAAGLQPQRGSAAPTTDFPKAALYAHTEREVDGVRVRGVALAGLVWPTADGLRSRPFLGVQPQVWTRAFTLSADALVDRDPATSGWTFSRLGARASAQATAGLRVYAEALRRRPYLLAGGRQALLDASTRVSGGVDLALRGGALSGASVRAEASSGWTGAFAPTRTLGGGLHVPRLPGLGLGLSADATVWTQDDVAGAQTAGAQTAGDQRGLSAGASLSRYVGSGFVQAGYRLGRSPLGVATADGRDALTTQGFDALLQLPVTPRIALTLQATVQTGDVLRSTRLYTALWWRL